jgi:hypothetical protein
MGMVILKVIIDVLKIRCGGGCPADSHLRSEHLFEKGVHFRFVYELTAVGLRDTFPNGSPKVRVFLKQAQSGFLH